MVNSDEDGVGFGPGAVGPVGADTVGAVGAVVLLVIGLE